MLLVVGLLCGGLVSLLLLNTVLAQDSFRASELRQANNQLREKKEELKNFNLQLEMPDALARNSRNQGQEEDWNRADVILSGRSGTRATGDGRTLVGQERAPGTNQ